MTPIQTFLSCHRIALIGLSLSPEDFSRTLFKEFINRGYDIVPVNPAAQQIEDRFCYPSVESIAEKVEGALVMTSPAESADVVRQCIAAGVKNIWLYRGTGRGAVSDEAVRLCQISGVTLVAGACPFMHFPNTQWIHRVHGFFARLSGAAPA